MDKESTVERIDTCEAIVVGAGLVGAAVAANLAAEGLEVAVLEARDVASGATGRTAGLVFTGLPTPYAGVAQERGREMAQALWRLTLDNRARLTSACAEMGLAVARPGSLTLATDSLGTELLRASAEMLDADGFQAHFEAGDPLKRGFASALSYPDDVVVDTVALAKGLLQGILVHTGTEVYGLEQHGEDVLVLARGRSVKAGTVVLAVNAYAPLLDGYFADKVAPVRGQLFSTHPLEERLLERPGNAGPFSFHQAPDGRLSFTAFRPGYETPAGGPGDESAEVDLMRFVGHHFPEAVQRFVHRSSSVMGASRDGLPLIGSLPRLPQVFFAVGFGRYGLSFAFSAADLLTGLIMRGAEPPLLSALRLE